MSTYLFSTYTFRAANCARFALLWLVVCTPVQAEPAGIGEPIARRGDEIMVCGQLYHTTAPVILWTDPEGYDAYRVERRFDPAEESSWEQIQADGGGPGSPNRYGLRQTEFTEEELQRVRGGGWDLALLRGVVDQFVLHYDVCGTSQTCFRILHDKRGLSVHFMLDVDGTIYQTLDLKERAWHATISNTRSIGVEIAQIGAYPEGKLDVLRRWYRTDEGGETWLNLPKPAAELGVRTPNFQGRPMRDAMVRGAVQGEELAQYDFTPEQYDSLMKLTATLCTIFPKLKCDYPKDEAGKLIPQKLPDDELQTYGGVLGHYHVQTNKTDPGPVLQWDLLIDGARKLMGGG